MSADARRVIPDYLECGWMLPEEDAERTLPDDKRDYHPIYGWPHSAEPMVTDDTVSVLRF